MTPEQVREIAENSARIAATDAAEKAVRATLIALGVDVDNLHQEQHGAGLCPHHATGHPSGRDWVFLFEPELARREAATE